MSEAEAFETELAERGSDEPALLIDVEGFEGPLDLLLALARQQKVDLAKISILALAEQYLVFIEEARKLRLELAADYLVMAAWLAYLKSRLLLPEAGDPRWAVRRGHGECARLAAEAPGGVPRGRRASSWAGRNCSATCSSAATPSRSPTSSIRNGPRRSTTCSRPMPSSASRAALQPCAVQEAQRLGAAGCARDPGAADRAGGRLGAGSTNILMEYLVEPSMRATVMASSLAATLELVREGALEVHQQSAFAPIYLRKRDEAALAAVNSSTAMPRATE